MAGGDSRIVGGAAMGLQSAAQALKAGAIDANSKAAGTFTEKRSVDGQDVWLTPAGAQALDKMKAAADESMFELRVQKDPGAIAGWFMGDKENPATVGKR